jgi:prepilin-type N-terminal cleavage/methylation domain-containing protein
MTKRGFTLVEVAVAVAVLGMAGLALQRLALQSLGTIERDAARARTLVAARARLAEAALRPPAPGSETWTEPGGIRTTRVVTRTAHPRLREVRVRAERADGRETTNLVELVYAPAD